MSHLTPLTPTEFLVQHIFELALFVVLFAVAIGFARSGLVERSKAARVVVILMLTGVGCTNVCKLVSDYDYQTTPHNEWSGLGLIGGVVVGGLSIVPLSLAFHLIVQVGAAKRRARGPVRR
jgi:hypothetical protein